VLNYKVTPDSKGVPHLKLTHHTPKATSFWHLMAQGVHFSSCFSSFSAGVLYMPDRPTVLLRVLQRWAGQDNQTTGRQASLPTHRVQSCPTKHGFTVV